MSASLNTIAPALLLCQPDVHQDDYEYPGAIDEDEDQPYTLVHDGSMTLADVRHFFATLRSDPAELQVLEALPTPPQPTRRFKTETHRIKVGAVVAAKWTDKEYYPALVLRRCSRTTFEVRFLADGIVYIAQTRTMHSNPRFGMCDRDKKVWATGRVKTFDKKQYRF
jgi:hypothetical protein